MPGLASSVQLLRDAVTEVPVADRGPGVEGYYKVRCPYGTGPSTYQWALLAEFVDRQALIDDAYDEARSAVPLPSLNIWPAPEFGVPVQYGMWLAVNEPGQINAFAEVGPVWASVTARFVRTSFDMDNGDVVVCEGLGTPYPYNRAPLDYSQGPCGYMFTEAPDVGVRQLAAIGHWDVELVTSDGVNEMLDPIDAVYGFDYEVYEVETVVVG